MKRATIVCVAFATAMLSATTSARADDLNVIKNAMLASQRSASGFRQYLRIEGGAERLMSITLGSSVYLALGPGHWQQLPRNEVEELNASAATRFDFSVCTATGEEFVKGMTTTGYRYSSRQGNKSSLSHIWIGYDGLVRQQSVPGRGVMRYEYDDVKAPS